METGNKFALFLVLVLALSAPLLHPAQAVCVPRTFKYLQPASGSPAPSTSSSQVFSSSIPSPPVISSSTPSTPVTTPSTPSTPSMSMSASIQSTAQQLQTGLSSIVSGLTLQGPEIQKICALTDHPLICLTYIPAFLQGKFDKNSIILAEISAIKNTTTVIVELANKLTADPKTDDDVVEALDYCKENYESALSNLDDAVTAVAAHDSGALGSNLSATASDISTCQDTFQEVTPIPSPLAAMDDIAKKLVWVTLATIDNYKG